MYPCTAEAVPFISADVSSGVQHTSPICVSLSDTPPSNIKKCLSFESVSTVEGTEVSVENTSRQPVSTGELSPEKSEIRDSEVSPSDTPPSNIKKYLSFESVSTVEGTEVSVENTSRQPVSTGELSPEKSEIGDSEVISLETATATPIAISSEEDKGETDSDSDDADNKLEMLFKRTRHYIENGRKPKIEPVLRYQIEIETARAFPVRILHAHIDPLA